MALRLSTDLKNYVINQGIVKMMAGTMGTGGSASISIYTGSQPVNADAGTSGTLLCTIINIGWGGTGAAGTVGATAGTASHSSGAPGYIGTASISGVTGWARMETVGTGFTGSAATFRIDGDVGTGATCAFIINNTTVTAAGSVTLLTCPISVG